MDLFLLKIISLRIVHIAHSKAHTPTLLWPLLSFSTPFNHFPNIFETLDGGGKLKVYKLSSKEFLQKGMKRKDAVLSHLDHKNNT
jgi:hypothetical protein